MKFVRISQTELTRVRQLYESIMSYACHGLFFREGYLYGEEIVFLAKRNEDDFLETAASLMQARGWADSVKLHNGEAIVKGSIETKPDSDTETCHRLRGVITRVYQEHLGGKVNCMESSCQSMGKSSCVFIIEPKSE